MKTSEYTHEWICKKCGINIYPTAPPLCYECMFMKEGIMTQNEPYNSSSQGTKEVSSSKIPPVGLLIDGQARRTAYDSSQDIKILKAQNAYLGSLLVRLVRSVNDSPNNGPGYALEALDRARDHISGEKLADDWFFTEEKALQDIDDLILELT